MSTASSSSDLCHREPPGYFDRTTNPYPFAYHPDSVYIRTDPSKNSIPHPCRIPPSPPKRRSWLFSCCLWLSVLIITLIYLLALCLFLLYFYIHPKFPEFCLDRIALSQIKRSNESGDLPLSSQFDAAVEVTNKNSVLRFKYSQINITVRASGAKDNDTLLGRGTAPGFEQGQRNATLVRAKIVVLSAVVVDANTAEEVVDRMNRGDLTVAVEVATSVKVTVRDWNVIEVPVHLLCKGVEAGAAKSGSSRGCRLDLFRM